MEYFRDEHELFRLAVRRFVQEKITPNVDDWEENGEIPRDLFLQLGQLGFLGIEYPDTYGGSNADFWMTVVLAEELARCRAGGVAFSVIVHTDMSSPWLVRLGTDDQSRDVVARLIYGFRAAVLFGLILTLFSGVIGVTAGASTPEFLVKELVSFMKKQGIAEVEELEGPDEDVVFQLPTELTAGKIAQIGEEG